MYTLKQLGNHFAKDNRGYKCPLIVEIKDLQFYIKDVAYDDLNKIGYLFTDSEYNIFSPHNLVCESKNVYRSGYKIKIISEELITIENIKNIRFESGIGAFGDLDKQILVC